MKYAVVQVAGKQFKVEEGQTFKIERQKAVKLEVLAYNNGSETFIGSPFLTDIKIKLKPKADELGPKLRVARFKAKSRYKKKNGHRQPYSIVTIEEIIKDGETKAEKKVAKEEVKAEKPVVKAKASKKAVKKEIAKEEN